MARDRSHRPKRCRDGPREIRAARSPEDRNDRAPACPRAAPRMSRWRTQSSHTVTMAHAFAGSVEPRDVVNAIVGRGGIRPIAPGLAATIAQPEDAGLRVGREID